MSPGIELVTLKLGAECSYHKTICLHFINIYDVVTETAQLLAMPLYTVSSNHPAGLTIGLDIPILFKSWTSVFIHCFFHLFLVN